ncbi:MAG: 30S ribosomal protein S17 [Armatimonadetes bacterium]|nr:30S ribosomal protein S17 [Armatimonadota bacterium]MDW8153593.1 30S ribosomal protein S17 [Armatimonadota bacterium]
MGATLQRGKRKVLVGEVVSDRMDKTVVVRVETVTRHPLYQKPVRRHKKVKAHDEHNACRVGDVVRIMETRPLSKEKRWWVVEILQRAHPAAVEAGEEAGESPEGVEVGEG